MKGSVKESISYSHLWSCHMQMGQLKGTKREDILEFTMEQVDSKG